MNLANDETLERVVTPRLALTTSRILGIRVRSSRTCQ